MACSWKKRSPLAIWRVTEAVYEATAEMGSTGTSVPLQIVAPASISDRHT